MQWSDVKPLVAKFAPTLGAALGGPGGEALGTVIASAFGLTAATPDAVAAAIQADPSAAAKLAELQTKHAETIAVVLARLAATQTTEGASTVRVEATSDSWLAKNWRPILMLLFGVIIANNYIIAPYVQAMFGAGVSLPIPPDMWALLKIGVGGYVVGRSGEKMLASYLRARSS